MLLRGVCSRSCISNALYCRKTASAASCLQPVPEIKQKVQSANKDEPSRTAQLSCETRSWGMLQRPEVSLPSGRSEESCPSAAPAQLQAGPSCQVSAVLMPGKAVQRAVAQGTYVVRCLPVPPLRRGQGRATAQCPEANVPHCRTPTPRSPHLSAVSPLLCNTTEVPHLVSPVNLVSSLQLCAPRSSTKVQMNQNSRNSANNLLQLNILFPSPLALDNHLTSFFAIA